MRDLQALTQVLNNIYPELQEHYGVKSMAIFGSRVSGHAEEDSDLDVLVEFEEPVGLLKFQELEEKLSQGTGLKVDLVMRNTLRPRIGTRILDEAVAVHSAK